MIVRRVAGLLLGMIAFMSQPALARNEHATAKSVAVVRIGLLPDKSPRIGPQLVYRGGYTPLEDMVRPRFIGGMIDIYPSSRSGFRLSAGTRYFARTNFWVAAEQATDGLLYDPHMTRGGRSLARGFRRYTPAATLGYDQVLTRGLVVGLEGGALRGRAILPIQPVRFGPDDRRIDKTAANPIATLSARLAF
jgi:hypothetical protein